MGGHDSAQTFKAKLLGSVPVAARTQRAKLPLDLGGRRGQRRSSRTLTLYRPVLRGAGVAALLEAAARIKRVKPAVRKVDLTISAVTVRVTLRPAPGDVLENDAIDRVAFCGNVPGHKDRVACVCLTSGACMQPCIVACLPWQPWFLGIHSRC